MDSVLLILSNRIDQEVKVTKKYSDLPLIYCQPAQLNQVFMNILSNAIDALLVLPAQAHKQIVYSRRLIFGLF